ncbi:hypothetical protein GCM10017687_05460 [Streptomyces echinatus]
MRLAGYRAHKVSSASARDRRAPGRLASVRRRRVGVYGRALRHHRGDGQRARAVGIGARAEAVGVVRLRVADVRRLSWAASGGRRFSMIMDSSRVTDQEGWPFRYQ